MDLHIDWLTWTEKRKLEPRTHAELYDYSKQTLKELDDEYWTIFAGSQGLEPCSSRPPYRIAIQRDDHGSVVYGSSHTGTLCFELTGRGCEPLRSPEVGRWFVAGISERITRIDFAVDVRCLISPSEFANARDSKKFRSVSFIQSDTGQTVYLGSPKSDRFARVYRYNKPHPRSDLLRVEFVFRRKLAKIAAEAYAQEVDGRAFVASLGNTWGLTHAVWQPGVVTDEKVRTPIVLQKDADTVYWLYKQVAPAMARLIGNGALDMTDFLETVYDKANLPDQ